MNRTLALLIVGVPLVASAAAQTLNAAMTVDNAFDAYISSSPSVLGTLFLSGNSWGTTFTASVMLPAGTSYINVLARDSGPPAMFIGDFDVTGATFAAGGNELLTGSTGWTVSTGGITGTFGPTFDLGPNGSSPWGNFGLMSPNARFVWDAAGSADLVFQAAVIAPVPEPASLAVLGAGALALLRRRRRA